MIGLGALSTRAEEAVNSTPAPGKTLTSAVGLETETTATPNFVVGQASVIGQASGTSSETTPGTSSGQSPSTTTPGAAPGTTVPGQPPADVVAPSPTNPKPRSTTPDLSPAPSPTTPGSTVPGPTTPEVTPPGTVVPDNTVPGTTSPGTTSPGTTRPVPLPSSQSQAPIIESTPDTTVTPGRATRSGSSYFGVGGNIGIGSGDTALGDGSFAVLSKIGLTRSFSVRPSLLISDDVTILLPVTYDFNFGEGPTGGIGFRAAPFVGIGPAITTGGGGDVDLLLTGGVDVPISSQFTATASVNATVTGNPAVGILLGIGYNFAGF
jgi:hypothetical protein